MTAIPPPPAVPLNDSVGQLLSLGAMANDSVGQLLLLRAPGRGAGHLDLVMLIRRLDEELKLVDEVPGQAVNIWYKLATRQQAEM